MIACITLIFREGENEGEQIGGENGGGPSFRLPPYYLYKLSHFYFFYFFFKKEYIYGRENENDGFFVAYLLGLLTRFAETNIIF